MIVPAAYFSGMPERSTCNGSMETGAPIVAGDDVVRYIQSIAVLRNKRGLVVGWVYRAVDQNGRAAEYTQAGPRMTPSDRGALRLRLTGSANSSVALLARPLPGDLRVMQCFGRR